jgi:hypothetical protein
MDQQSLIFTFLVAIVTTALMLTSVQFLAKKQKIQIESEQKINISYSIWISSLMITFFMFLKVALVLIENSIELIIFSKTIEAPFMTVMEKIIIFTGFTFISTFLSYFLVHNLLNILFGSRVNSIEMEKDNRGYFLIKALILILFTFSVLTIFQNFLEWFTIKIDTPFYH